MNTFVRSIQQVFKGALGSFMTFPAAVLNALIFAAVTVFRIALDPDWQDSVNFLLDCLQWSLAFGAVFSLAAITATRSRFKAAWAFPAANLLGAAAVAAAAVMLYFLGGTRSSGGNVLRLSDLAAARVGAAIAVSLILFVLLAASPSPKTGFADSFFMTHKAFFIALLYGLVIFGGAAGVAGAVEALLYRDMSSKVYGYIACAAGFLAFSIFAGHFPDFRPGEGFEKRASAEKQPRFIEVLFGYILTPIVLALTAVLLIWAAKTAVGGMGVEFVRLSSVAAAYTIGGLWLMAMVAGHETGITRLYRRVYPVASIVILVFEAWAVAGSLMNEGLKTTQYAFILIWIVAAAGALLLLLIKNRAHPVIAGLTCALSIVAVLPGAGYKDLPVAFQVNRLENLLTGQSILQNGVLAPAAVQPPQAVREDITDAVTYLADTREAKLPAWFDEDLGSADVFREKLGFDLTWPGTGEGGSPAYLSTNLYLGPGAIEINGYRWALNPQDYYKNNAENAAVAGDRGLYTVYWTTDGSGMATVKITLDEKILIEQDMSVYVQQVADKYPLAEGGSVTAGTEDMTFEIITPEIGAMLVFRTVDISKNAADGEVNYWFDLDAVYLKENP